jgi:hypothetical protein
LMISGNGNWIVQRWWWWWSRGSRGRRWW